MIRLGLVQMEPRILEVEHNTRYTKKILASASELDIDVLVLPELANSGYVFDTISEVEKTAEVIPTGPYSELLKDWSHSGGLVVAGVCESQGDEYYNSAIAFAGGEYLGTYRKIHLFDRESEWFLPGNEEPPVFEWNEHKYGVMICFDWAFPEIARILALKGAQVILHPANLVLPYCQRAMVTRSIENRVFTATANRIGHERGLKFSGQSQVTSPRGERLLTMEQESELRFIDIDPHEADNKMITQRNHVLNDRRSELYHRLV